MKRSEMAVFCRARRHHPPHSLRKIPQRLQPVAIATDLSTGIYHYKRVLLSLNTKLLDKSNSSASIDFNSGPARAIDRKNTDSLSLPNFLLFFFCPWYY